MFILGSDEMSFTEKVDVLDLIIETLRAHEKTLNELACRLEACLKATGKGGKAPFDVPGESKSLEEWR
jgi:hypothetical protein